MADFTVKSDDVGPVIEASLKQGGNAVDLTGATVRFLMADAGTRASKIDAVAAIVTAATGAVSYTFTAADLDTPGSYLGEWQVTFGDGTIATFPSAGYNKITVTADLN